MKRVLLGIFVLLSAAVSARGDDIPLEQKIGDCYVTKDDGARLKCYDSSIKQEIEKYNAKQDIVRQEWHGSGLLTTRPFHMSGPWEFEFFSKGSFFSAMLYHKGDVVGEAMPNMLANQGSKGDGSSYVDTAGDYYIVINAIGPWKAKAVLVNQ